MLKILLLLTLLLLLTWVEATCKGQLILHGDKDFTITYLKPKTFGVNFKATKATVKGNIRQGFVLLFPPWSIGPTSILLYCK